MTVRIYRSTDASAPVLSGTAGALLTVLDAVLVNGYGSTSAAGWTIAYTATNKRQYQMAAGGTGCQLYIDDSAPGAGGAREARMNGFKTGTAIGVGTGQFPNVSQIVSPPGALAIRKSTTADSTARPWTIIADGRTLYMFVDTGDQPSPFCTYPWMFGDFNSYCTTDVSNCIIIGRQIENNSTFSNGNAGTSTSYLSTGWYENFCVLAPMTTTGLFNPCGGHYVAGNYTNIGSSIPVGKHTDQAKMGGSYGAVASLLTGYLGSPSIGSGNSGATWVTEFQYPNGPDSGLYMAPLWIHHNGYVRGYFRGLWSPLQHHPLSHNDTFTGTGNVSGKSFIAQDVLGTSTIISNQPQAQFHVAAQIFVEYSDTWT